MTKIKKLLFLSLFIFTAVFSGCDILDDLGDILDDDSTSKRPLEDDDDDDNDDNDDNDTDENLSEGFDPSNIVVAGDSDSIGAPNNGTLENGIQLDESDDIHVITASRAWGTVEIIWLLKVGAAAVSHAYPDTMPLVVGDISIESGGPLDPHRTHQSGRDVDAGLYMADNEYEPDWFPTMTASNTDIEKNWLFIQTLAETGMVSHILLDYDVQGIFYEALEGTVDDDLLSSIFQYPRPIDDNWGVLVWHVDGHDNHYHIEIMCPEGDNQCTEWE
jgi:Penicillin-insensitive murein endopeptidase